jgi:hypothetical protein
MHGLTLFTPRVNPPAGLAARLAQRAQERLPVGVVLEDRLAAVAPVHHVVDRAGIFDAQRAGHPRIVVGRDGIVNTRN